MDNISTTTPPTPHLTLQDAVSLLQSYGWTPGQITTITAQTDLDWIESRERAQRLADITDARAALLAAAAPPQPTGTATRVARPKVKRVAPGTGTATIQF